MQNELNKGYKNRSHFLKGWCRAFLFAVVYFLDSQIQRVEIKLRSFSVQFIRI